MSSCQTEALSESSVVYFNRGTSCYIRLLVSIFSLRKYYGGPVTLLQEGQLDAGIADLFAKLNVEIQTILETSDKTLVRKASLWREVRHEHIMYLDADTLVRGAVHELIDWVKEWGFVATWFSGWETTGPRMRSRIEEWRRIVPELIAPALAYGKAINTGVVGWSKGSAILPEYEALTRRGDQANCNRLVVDEVALQLLLPHYRHYTSHHAWNTSGAFGDTARARIVHYHGKKHCLRNNERCELWKQHYFELLSSFPGYAGVVREAWDDRRFREWISNMCGKRKDLTVVTSVDPGYAPKLKRNLKKWMNLPGLREQQFLVFVNGFKGPRQRRFLNLPNVKVVRWSYGFPAASQRETMLASFVFGVAKHVRTEYWMKLDADCSPKRPWWEWPELSGCSIVSHRWGYTRMKGDLDSRIHWFNRLDEVFCPDSPNFKRIFTLAEQKLSHRPGNANGLPERFASFCHIERTAFTRRIAEHLLVRLAGKLPIPSQDTLSWYCALIWNERVKLMNMKKWFRP
jgi:hypothetical protein